MASRNLGDATMSPDADVNIPLDVQDMLEDSRKGRETVCPQGSL